jgi:FdhD protein
MTAILPSSSRLPVTRLENGQFTAASAAVITEQELVLYVNGKKLATASLAPGMEKEFAAGYLFGQGFIDRADDIESIIISGGAAQITLKKDLLFPSASYRIVSGGGRSAYFEEAKINKIKSDIIIGKQDIFRAMNTLFDQAVLYKETEGAHAAGLFNPKAEPICIVEDIGRHNTLDKLCGYCLLKKISTSKTFLVSTGRMASEMVTKICRAAIPIAATKTAITDKGLEIAKQYGLTLIGFVRDAGNRINTDMDVRIIKESGMKTYSGISRIGCE